MTAVFALLLAVYGAVTASRLALAVRWLRQTPPPDGDEGAVTILQPILSGDPQLEACLAANITAAPRARFMLLVDEDDQEAIRIATSLAGDRVEVVIGPPPTQGDNPKVAKLARALDRVGTPLFAVLDDDTILPPGGLGRAVGALDEGDLVCGLPLYDVAAAGLWSRLLGAFVNGSALITYPCADLLGAQRTVNGMFVLGRVEELGALGGFEAIRTALTDDYALARLYLNAGRPLVQTRVMHPIRTTVTGPGHYASIMRRWMIFALRYLRENQSPFTLGLIGIGTLSPPILVVLGTALGPAALSLALGALLMKALALASLRFRAAGIRVEPSAILFEILADLLTPLHLASALARPQRLRWRSRVIRMEGERIAYD